MKRKNLAAIIPLILISFGCNVSYTPVTTTKEVAVTATPVKSSLTVSSPISSTFDNLPENSDTTSLEDKYDLQTYIENNKVLDNIPNTLVDGYKVHFTSDGGAVFSVKDASGIDVIWSRTPKKLIFDTFQLLNIQEKDQKYYSRYSQLVENEIKVKNDPDTFTKKVNLVQTVGISLIRNNNNYKIASFTPVIIRQVDKNNLSYKIEKMVLTDKKNTININNDKTLIPWPGIPVNDYLETKNINIDVTVSSVSASLFNQFAVIASIGGQQFQLTKKPENVFSGEIKLPSLSSTKTSLVIELIDKNSLDNNVKYNGYTWIVPLVASSN